MKIFANNAVYVQNKDLANLLRIAEGISIPGSIFEKVFGDVFYVDSSNEYDFVPFSSPKEIEFFGNCDWIVDYNAFDGMTEDEIKEYACQVNEEKNATYEAYQELSKEEKDRYYEQVLSKLQALEYKFYSVRDVLWHKQGHLDFRLPQGTVDSYFPVKEEKVEVSEEAVPATEEVVIIPEKGKKIGAFRKVMRGLREILKY